MRNFCWLETQKSSSHKTADHTEKRRHVFLSDVHSLLTNCRGALLFKAAWTELPCGFDNDRRFQIIKA